MPRCGRASRVSSASSNRPSTRKRSLVGRGAPPPHAHRGGPVDHPRKPSWRARHPARGRRGGSRELHNVQRMRLDLPTHEVAEIGAASFLPRVPSIRSAEPRSAAGFPEPEARGAADGTLGRPPPALAFLRFSWQGAERIRFDRQPSPEVQSILDHDRQNAPCAAKCPRSIGRASALVDERRLSGFF